MKTFFVTFGFTYACIALVVLATGCTLNAQSSTTILGPKSSSAVIRRPVGDAAVEVTRLFAARGYMLMDQRPAGATLVLRLQGARRMVVEHKRSAEVGSAYYVFVDPQGDGSSAISLIGRPMYDGAELCTDDPSITTPCRSAYYGDVAHDTWLDGRAEAEVIRACSRSCGSTARSTTRPSPSAASRSSASCAAKSASSAWSA